MPRIKNEKVGKFILEAETPAPIDTSTYVANFEQALPKLKGAKAHAIPGILRDLPEVKHAPETTAFVGIPRHGVCSAADICQEELQSHYFTPNFLRPLPEAEDDPDLDGSVYDFSQDALYLVPGMLPEPYWDLNLVSDSFTYQEMKKYLQRATKHALKPPEQRMLINCLNADKELVFHIDMTPAKLPDLIINNQAIAVQLLICMTNTSEITKYYDVLSHMKISVALLEVFNSLSQFVEFPKEFIQLFLKNCMTQCQGNAQGENKVNRTRTVRVVVVFLQNILKQKLINFDDVSTDIRQFCMEHTTVKEC